MTFSAFNAYTNSYKYAFAANATKGIYDYTRTSVAGLNEAVADTTTAGVRSLQLLMLLLVLTWAQWASRFYTRYHW